MTRCRKGSSSNRHSRPRVPEAEQKSTVSSTRRASSRCTATAYGVMMSVTNVTRSGRSGTARQHRTALTTLRFVCGIAGMLGFNDGFPVGEDVAKAMTDAISHRGPDDEGAWAAPEQRVALGHRRLSIVDLSPAGHQPMSNEDGTVWIAFNGEIYNHAQLRPELEAKGHVYRSHTDTETIVHLYEEMGERCVERLDGMFAFAIWDTRRRELFLARDRVGKKPLYYAQTPAGFVFASEIKAILEHPAVTPDLDEQAFHHYLTFVCTPAPLTMFKGIRKLAPSETMLVRADGTATTGRFWSPMAGPPTEELASMGEDALEARLLELLRGGIAKRMMADVPFGVFL